MSQALKLIIIIVIACNSLTIQCSSGIKKTNESDSLICDYGIIEFISLEGGFHGIISRTGKKYLPINLDVKGQLGDDSRIFFKAKIRLDIVTFYQWGTPIEIIKIRPCRGQDWFRRYIQSRD